MPISVMLIPVSLPGKLRSGAKWNSKETKCNTGEGRKGREQCFPLHYEVSVNGGVLGFTSVILALKGLT